MKTKTFLLLCLCLGIGLTQLSAQNGKDGTGTLNIWWVWDGYYIDIPVNFNNEDVDRLVGKVTVHNFNHYQRDANFLNFLWVKQHFNGKVTCAKTGEVFIVKDIVKSDYPGIVVTGHVNLKGDRGSHYIVTDIYDMNTDTFDFIKAVCNSD